MEIAEEERRRAFSMWLRTGRWPTARGADGIELKFNPWHDPKDGRFTFANNGNYSKSGWRDGGFSGGGGGSFGGGGAQWNGDWGPADKPKPAAHPHPTPPSKRALPAKPARRPAPSQAAPSRVATEPLRHVMRNGYDYGIDANGRTRTVSGNLSIADAPLRSRTAQAKAGGADRRPSDDGGHYIAARFNGPTDAFNHFAQDANFNRGSYRALEDQWARAKKAGKSVFVRIVPSYEGKSQRPAQIDVWFTINGHEESLKFDNEAGAKKHVK